MLTPGGPAEISDRPDEDSRLVTIGDSGVDVPATGRSGACVVAVLWRETLDEQLATGVVQQFVERHTPWLRIYSEGVPPDDLAVVLGTVALDNGVVRAPGAGVGDRHGVLPAMEGLRLRAAATGSNGVSDAAAGQLGSGRRAGDAAIDTLTGLEVSAASTGAPGGTAQRLSLGDAHRGRIGVAGAAAEPSAARRGRHRIRQNSTYLSGGPGWSSLSYNAHHDEANGGVGLPDRYRPAVTVEMDDAGRDAAVRGVLDNPGCADRLGAPAGDQLQHRRRADRRNRQRRSRRGERRRAVRHEPRERRCARAPATAPR